MSSWQELTYLGVAYIGGGSTIPIPQGVGRTCVLYHNGQYGRMRSLAKSVLCRTCVHTLRVVAIQGGLHSPIKKAGYFFNASLISAWYDRISKHTRRAT